MSYYGKLYVNDLEVITTAATPELKFPNVSGFTTTIKNNPSVLADYTLTLPVDDGDSGDILSTDGAGALSWVSNGVGSGPDLTLTTTTPTITLSGTAANLIIGDDTDTVTIAADAAVATAVVDVVVVDTAVC